MTQDFHRRQHPSSHYLSTLSAAAFLSLSSWQFLTAAENHAPLDGQIMRDPNNPSYLVYNRDANGDGRLDPCYLIGPGDPEGLLFLGQRRPDGTRVGGRQREIIGRLADHGGNVIYFQAVRSHGGDGAVDHNPWQDPSNPSSGLDVDIVQQWRGWFDQMRKAGMVLLLFVYDDGAHPFDDGCQGSVGQDEENFIQELVDAVEDYPNLIWVVQEEFKFVGHSGTRRPCDNARFEKAAALARLIKKYDNHQHLVGVHHNIGDQMAFPDSVDFDIYVQQADVRPAAGKGNLAALHAAGQPDRGFDQQHRYIYFMGEGYDWHAKLVAAGKRHLLRQSYYATGFSGGYVTVLGMFPTEEGAEPTDEMLRDMRRMQLFLESTRLNEVSPHDELRYGDTRWVLAHRQQGVYFLYADANATKLGIKALHGGRYRLRWFDPATGKEVLQQEVEAEGDSLFETPAEFRHESVLYITKAAK